MKCPHCGAEMSHWPLNNKWVCAACELSGPRDVLEALAARLAPAGVLAAAEKLLRESGVTVVKLHAPDPDHPDACIVTGHVPKGGRSWETWGGKTMASLHESAGDDRWAIR